uniref:Uncharacterized protein n=1 Tax=Panagrolaimus superbus TaxID=310955 RepID=A0A914YP37_9BILA
MLTILEITKWTGVTPFELFLHITAFLISTVLLAGKWLKFNYITYWQIFTPLFIASALNIYFLFIIFVRSLIENKQFKNAFLGSVFNFIRVFMITIFLILICHKIDGDLEHREVAVHSSYGIIFMPIWIVLTAFGFQACRMF